MDIRYFKTLCQENNNLDLYSLMVNTQTIGMENAVIVMQYLSKSDWC